MIAAVIIAALVALFIAGAVIAAWRIDAPETPRRACLSAAGVLLPWSRVAGRARGWGRTMLPIRGDAQEREGGCAPADSRPAAGAGLTGLLSPRPHQEGAPAASAPPPGPARMATAAERDWWLDPDEQPSRLKVVIEASTPQDMAGEIAATSPWNDEAGSFTAYIDAGEPS